MKIVQGKRNLKFIREWFNSKHFYRFSYFECHNYVPTLRTCSAELYYNHLTQMCDLKSKVPCIMIPELESEEDDYNADGNVLFDCIFVRYFIPIFSFLVEISCPPTGAHFYPHPYDCQHYFLCVNGISAKLDCGHNMIYDYATQKCDLPARATCIVSVL